MKSKNRKVSVEDISVLEKILSHKEYLMNNMSIQELNDLLKGELFATKSTTPRAKRLERFYSTTRYQFEANREGWLTRSTTLQKDEEQYLQKASADILDGLPAETQRALLASEIADMNRRPQCRLSAARQQGNLQLNTIIEVLQNEAKALEDGSPISFDLVETSLARYISQCLSDFGERKCGMKRVLKHVKNYEVVRPVHGQMPSISLHKVHLILQDNYQDSSLCRLFNLLLGATVYQTKVITFF